MLELMFEVDSITELGIDVSRARIFVEGNEEIEVEGFID
jgi:hypothetical protein